MKMENGSGGAEGTNSKRKILLWIIFTVLAVMVVELIVLLVLDGKKKPSGDKSTDDPSRITVWRLTEETIEVSPELINSHRAVTDYRNLVQDASMRTVYTYDEAGNPIKWIRYDESGREIRRVETDYQCDSEGRWQQVLQKTTVEGSTTVERHEFLYDDRGNRIRKEIYIKYPSKEEETLFSDVEYEYNEDNLLVRSGVFSYVYNERGQVTQDWVGEELMCEYTYDDKGNLQKWVYYVTTADPGYTYDKTLAVGDVRWETTYKNGHKIEPTFDEYGHPIREYDEDGNILWYKEYRVVQNAMGDQSRVTAMSDYHYEGGLLTEVITTKYDKKGEATGASKVVYVRDEDGNVRQESYNAKNVLTRCIEEDKYGNVWLEEQFDHNGVLIFRLERSYVPFQVSVWALTQDEVSALRDLISKYRY